MRVEHLDLVLAHEKDAAVAAALALAAAGSRRSPLNVQLNVAVSIAGEDRAAAGHCSEASFLDDPLGGAAVGCAPAGQIGPVKQHNSIGRRRDGKLHARLDLGRNGPRHVMDLPAGVGLGRRRRSAQDGRRNGRYEGSLQVHGDVSTSVRFWFRFPRGVSAVTF